MEQEVVTVGLDLAKTVFQVHAIAADGAVLIRRKLRRTEVIRFFAKLSPCLVGMEACASAHHWARELIAIGHEVRLMPPAYVKPFVKRQKNDMADAEAICEAADATHDALCSGEERRDPGRGDGLPGPGVADPAAHAGDQRIARPSDRVRSDRATGSGQRCAADRDRGGSGWRSPC
mgnify:CR=1 FL=1